MRASRGKPPAGSEAVRCHDPDNPFPAGRRECHSTRTFPPCASFQSHVISKSFLPARRSNREWNGSRDLCPWERARRTRRSLYGFRRADICNECGTLSEGPPESRVQERGLQAAPRRMIQGPSICTRYRQNIESPSRSRSL